ncbi:hypothetical protein MN608_03022 [Microdochium nivale]|nr:hypothetical protein MN608_03022 [Microdochium nivale]
MACSQVWPPSDPDRGVVWQPLADDLSLRGKHRGHGLVRRPCDKLKWPEGTNSLPEAVSTPGHPVQFASLISTMRGRQAAGTGQARCADKSGDMRCIRLWAYKEHPAGHLRRDIKPR